VESGLFPDDEVGVGMAEDRSLPNVGSAGIVGNASNDALPAGNVVDCGETTTPISFPDARGDTVGVAPSFPCA